MSICVDNLSFAYGAHRVLENVGFEARDGELVAVLGPNGVGKSTLFKCILGLLPGHTGQTLVDGEPTAGMGAAKLARKMAYVPQSHYPSFNYSVLDMVLMGTTAQVGGLSSPGAAQVAVAEAALERLGVAHLRRRGFMQISGGERQLVLIARAIAQQARLLVMDEPTASLDYGNGLRVLGQVKALAQEGYCILMSTHNPDHAFLFADRVLAMQGGRLVADGPPDAVLTARLIHTLYGVEVLVRRPAGVAVCVPVLDGGSGEGAGKD